MIVFLNGQFVPEERATVSVFDRSFCLGDGLFEALPVYRGKIFLWEKHFDRFRVGADLLKIKIPFSPEALRAFAEQLLLENQMPECVLRIHLSRGVGPRGYSIPGAEHPTLVMSVHPARNISSPAKIIISSVRLMANDPLARFKSCNKLPHILARMEADAQNANEALLLNENGNVAEATSANIFWLEDETVCTPPLETSALPGITRGVVLELARDLGIKTAERNTSAEKLTQSDGVFLTSIASEIWEVSHLNGRNLKRSPLTQKLSADYKMRTINYNPA